MKKYDITLKLITPCISSGGNVIANERNSEREPYKIRAAEFRAPSIRGALRYWFRVLVKDKQLEKEIFGGIGESPKDCRASKIIVRVVKSPRPKDASVPEKFSFNKRQDYFLGIWNSSEKKSYFGEEQTARIQIIDKSESPEFEKALKAFLYLGAIGSRSRRTYGSIYPKSVSGWKDIPLTLKEFKEYLKNSGLRNAVVLKINPPQNPGQRQPPFRDSNSSRGQSVNDAVKNAQEYLKRHRSKYNSSPEDRVVLGLPFAGFFICDKKDKEKQDGNSDGNARWASPLLMKIVELDGKFIPIAIFLKDYFIPEGTEISQIISDDDEKMPKAKSPLPTKVSHTLINKMMSDGDILLKTT